MEAPKKNSTSSFSQEAPKKNDTKPPAKSFVQLDDDEDTFAYYHMQNYEGEPLPEDRRMYSWE